MSIRRAAALAVLAVAASSVSAVLAAPGRGTTHAAAPAARTAGKADTAVFAGGCFWSMESQFEGVPGVLSVVSGYTGGHVAHPSYEQVCTETTGHLESVRIVYDPSVVSYAALLDRYWHGIDPTQADGQFCDRGESYHSAIFYRDEAQRREALKTERAIERSGVLEKPIVTAIRPASVFWPAEAYHQDFAKKNPLRYRMYREGCGRDRWLRKVWGKLAVMPLSH